MTRKSNPYTANTTWEFETAGCGFAITSFDATHIEIEEIEKNGQEDTHFYGTLNKIDGRWILDGNARKHLRRYYSEATADAIGAFVNKHGLPGNYERSD